MYSSDADYRLRRAKAEQEVRYAQQKATLSCSEDASGDPLRKEREGGLQRLFPRLREDDLLLIALLFLIMNDSQEDDPLVLILLAALLFS